jgi:hypothetical protein
VHLIRHSLKYVPRKQYEQVTKDLRPICTAKKKQSDAEHSQGCVCACDLIVVAVLGDHVQAVLDGGGGDQRVGELDRAVDVLGAAVG